MFLLILGLDIRFNVSLSQTDGDIPLFVDIGDFVHLLSRSTDQMFHRIKYRPCSWIYSSVWLFHPSQIWSEQRFCLVFCWRTHFDPFFWPDYRIPFKNGKLLQLDGVLPKDTFKSPKLKSSNISSSKSSVSSFWKKEYIICNWGKKGIFFFL